MTSRLVNYGNYGICLIVGNAGFISSTVVRTPVGGGVWWLGKGWGLLERLLEALLNGGHKGYHTSIQKG